MDHLPSIEVGDIVVIAVDKRDWKVQNHRGLTCVVLKVSSQKSIQVVCIFGVIVQKGKMAWIPSNTYRIPNRKSTFTNDILLLQEAVKSGSIHPALKLKVSKPDAHFSTYGMQILHRCSCKTRCGPSCGCVKNNRICGSGCGCSINGFVCGNVAVTDEQT